MLKENEIKEISNLIMLKLNENIEKNSSDNLNGIFENLDEAIACSEIAQKKLFSSKLEVREKIIQSIRSEVKPYIEELALSTVKETGMGNVSDKIKKHYLVIEKTPGMEDLKTFAFSGDQGLTTMELSPYGVIGAITPSTNPTETIICNTIGMIASGNSVIFAPHPGAVNVSIRIVEIINNAIKKVNGPENLVITLRKPSMESVNKMLKHEKIKMLCATGGPGVVEAVLSSGKKAIGAGAGNPPAFVDETADLEKAAIDIINGCSFDNNLPCIAEKEVIVIESVGDYLIYQMQKNGAYLIKDKDFINKLADAIISNGKVNREFIGKSAPYILNKFNISVPEDIKVIIMEVPKEHPFVQEELLMPILPIVRVKNVEEGIKLCKEVEHGFRHTATIHSKNIDVLTKYAREMETTILVKNGPSYSGIGVGGEGYATFTIAGPTGEGLTSARSFARNRRCTLIGGFSLK